MPKPKPKPEPNPNPNQARLLLGVPLWRRRVRDGASADLDHAVRPTFVDG